MWDVPCYVCQERGRQLQVASEIARIRLLRHIDDGQHVSGGELDDGRGEILRIGCRDSRKAQAQKATQRAR